MCSCELPCVYFCLKARHVKLMDAADFLKYSNHTQNPDGKVWITSKILTEFGLSDPWVHMRKTNALPKVPLVARTPDEVAHTRGT